MKEAVGDNNIIMSTRAARHVRDGSERWKEVVSRGGPQARSALTGALDRLAEEFNLADSDVDELEPEDGERWDELELQAELVVRRRIVRRSRTVRQR